ncbi:hypothetical protein ACH4UM_36100 [Streptomyces sp. NPDC020801]|uniref:hypothetical protein n=1 Tax=Streptomyces sp. NPDC020801 TaxID=3365093 RepID=UPI0037AC0F3D
MNWSRLAAGAVAGLVLCGCGSTANTGGAGGHRTHQAPGGGTPGTPAPGAGKPMLILNGQLDARPGQLVDIRLDGISRDQGHDAVTARSPAFSGPVPLRWQNGFYGAAPALAMKDKPGWYELSVTVAGRAVARDRIHVVRSERPSFTLSVWSNTARPGQPVPLHFDDLYPGERGTDFTVRSAALPRTVRLVHNDVYDYYDPRAFSAEPQLKPGLADGTYTFGLYGAHGRRIAEKRLTVRSSRPGDPDYLGQAYGPDFFDPDIGYADSPRGPAFKVLPGGRVAVMWHDKDPDPGEERRLTATSPAFTHVLRLNADDSKGADGDDPRYYNTATVRAGLKPGRYPVTVVAHHGRVRKTSYLTVTAR